MYNVLESNIKFNNEGQILSILALVEYSQGDVRVIEATNQPRSGYMNISDKTDYILFDLLQEVAGYGMEITDKNKIPTEWFKKHFKSENKNS